MSSSSVFLRAPRLVATDLDGTLLRPDGLLSSRTRDALARAERAGIEIVFVTARPPRWVDVLHDWVGGHGTVLCANGAVVYDVRTRTVLAEAAMSAALVTEVVRLLRIEMGGISFAVERRDGIGTEVAFGGHHPLPPGSPVVVDIIDTLTPATYKLLATCPAVDPVDFLPRVASLLAGRAVLADSGAVGLAEITGPGVTKAATLSTWAASRNIDRADVWAFGDAPNDLAMLAWAGESFAVANAHPVVREAARHVCAANVDDGVAAVLERAVESIDGR